MRKAGCLTPRITPGSVWNLWKLCRGVCTDEGEEGYDLVRIKRTVKRETSGGPDDNFWLLRYCPEDGYWYALYYPNYVVRSVAYSLGVGSSIQECAVPPQS